MPKLNINVNLKFVQLYGEDEYLWDVLVRQVTLFEVDGTAHESACCKTTSEVSPYLRLHRESSHNLHTSKHQDRMLQF
ncbi:hypothetical protein K1T71_000174 [Dendrolimus kikuchii]|uniref:Uncharacterized protein n=1 Tax=Dendrolimus kikuchii TaxID=765133 RepID=A0ACC1DK47_9NEOP|nr:hypothetical protein K1T71_000174 [Dendrolimus kikuchii]